MDFSGSRGAFLGIGILMLVLAVVFFANGTIVGGVGMLIAGALFFGAAFGRSSKARKPNRG